MRKLFILMAILFPLSGFAAINTESEIGKSLSKTLFNQCFEGAMETTADISIARKYCRCAIDYVFQNIDMDDIIEEDMEQISIVMEKAISYCLNNI